jgi:D-glycero-beta-D-manno-heptose 1-phosphate adenylyltransferase
MVAKIVSLEELDDIVAHARMNRRRIVFTNGCFDLIHVGHLRSLEEARKLGDMLIVGINDDESVRLLKGSHRPIFPAEERAELIAGFACVDQVIIFSGATVSELLLRFKPEIHAKGTDYSEATVPEKNVVLSYGGRVAITGDPKNHSSSDILRDLKS